MNLRGEISPRPPFFFPTARAVGSGFLRSRSSPPPACLEGLEAPPLLRYASNRSVSSPLPNRFCLFAGPIFAIGDFSTTAPAQLQVFLKLQVYYRESQETLGNLRGCEESAPPFMREDATVYA